MTHQLLEELQSTKDTGKKAAIIAEFVFSSAESGVAQIARQCVILHWFDLPIVETFSSLLASSRMDGQSVYSQLASFSFIEKRPWGLTYNALTREGLLRQYTDLNPTLMIDAAHTAMNVYMRREIEGRQLSEAFYCAMISGDVNTSQALLQQLLVQAIRRENWLAADHLFQLQKEAELFPFVKPLLYTEHLSMLRALVRRTRGEHQAAITDYDHVIALHPTSGLAYSSRGTAYAECHRYQEALADYDQALALDPVNEQVKVSRDIILTKQTRLQETHQHYTNSLQYHNSIHDLWTAFLTTRHQDLREALIETYSPLVRFVVGRLGIPPTSLLELDDLVSYGMIGLIHAIDRFDLTSGVPFEAFATPHIREAVIDHLRSLNWQPRATVSRVRQVEVALASVEQRMGRPAKEEEVADELGVSIERYRQILLDASTTVLSLDIPVRSFHDDEMSPLKDLQEEEDAPGPAEEAERQEMASALSTAVEQIPEREYLLLALYYQEELTMKEISKIMDITESRVCQLHMQAIMRLRSIVSVTTREISSNKREAIPFLKNEEQEMEYFENKIREIHKDIRECMK